MKNIIVTFLCLVCAVITGISSPCQAAQIRLFVKDVNAVGAKNKDEMKVTLQTLLASRLNSADILSVGSAQEADVIVSGTYISIGKIFSIDALANTPSGKVVARSFVQGENQDELIPAIGKLAEKLSAELLKSPPPAGAASTSARNTPSGIIVPTVPSDIIKSEELRPAQTGDFIRQESTTTANGGWLSKRIEGAANLLATGATLADGSREFFLAGDRRISYYRKNNDLKLLDTAQLGNAEKIISIDTLEVDGKTELYVTIIRSSDVQSQVYTVQGEKLVKIAEKLPYYFRTASLAGGSKKLYVQGMGRDADFYGDVNEAKRSGTRIETGKTIKMPRFATLYTFNQFSDNEGKTFTTTFNPDGYLLVYDQDANELWRSNDKFGGSELYFQREGADPRVTGDIYRWIFMNQHIYVTSKNEVLVGKNDGFWVLGNARSYKKGAVYNLVWNGSSLEEKWRTRDTQNYMPDFLLDESRNELILLQVVQRPGISSPGASSLAIKKIQ